VRPVLPSGACGWLARRTEPIFVLAQYDARLPPEVAHEMTLRALEMGAYPRCDAAREQSLKVKLWQLDIRGWSFAALLAGWILIFDILEAVGATPLSAVLPSMVVSALVLIYCMLPGTRDHFSEAGARSVPATAPAATPPPA